MLVSNFTHAQDFLIDDGNISTCQGYFYDSGGAEVGYAPNENLSATICSNQSTGSHIQLFFSYVDLGQGDSLFIYDGNTANAPLINGPVYAERPFKVSATATNASGCLTVVFQSNTESTNNRGWLASIRCQQSCQPIVANINASAPEASTDAPYAIQTCPGDIVFLAANAVFPQNNHSYTQSLATATFHWTFGDGTTATGQTVSHHYEQTGGYHVQLIVEDSAGCKNDNFVVQDVYIAKPNQIEINSELLNAYCSGDTINISNNTANSPISSSGTTAKVKHNYQFNETLEIPDNSPAGYRESIEVIHANTDAILENAYDLKEVGIDIEHSWVGDLQIELICPNGASTKLLSNTNGIGSANFGEPYPSNNNCAGAMGNTYSYGIQNNAEAGTLNEAMTAAYSYTLAGCQQGVEFITFSDNHLPASIYKSEESFENLIGCPINGEWTIHVVDDAGNDNGYITKWGLEFTNSTHSDYNDFTPEIVSWGWEEHEAIINWNEENLSLSATNEGETIDTLSLNFWVENNFGCINSSSIDFEILPASTPECMPSATTDIINANFSIHPNPTSGICYLGITENEYNFDQIVLFNALGQQVLTQKIDGHSSRINMQQLNSGIYYIMLKGERGISSLERVIKQ